MKRLTEEKMGCQCHRVDLNILHRDSGISTQPRLKEEDDQVQQLYDHNVIRRAPRLSPANQSQWWKKQMTITTDLNG